MPVTNIRKGSLYDIAAFFCMAVIGILTKIALSFVPYLTGTFLLFPFIAQGGIVDLDHHFMYNTGFVGDRPLRIDL